MTPEIDADTDKYLLAFAKTIMTVVCCQLRNKIRIIFEN